MGLTSEGIEFVRAYELPGGIRTDGNYFGAPRCVLVKWRSSLTVNFYQVYVNGRYSGSTNDSEQRQLIAGIPTSSCAAVRIEVFAVEAEEADKNLSIDFPELTIGNGCVQVDLLRSQHVPIDAVANVYFDKGSGEIDYGETLNREPIRIWPSCRDKTGFGMSMFGEGDFGYDSAGAVGFGRGSFGNGQFGMDADSIEWISSVLADGTYKFAVVITDSAGNQSAASQNGEVTVTSRIRPAKHLNVYSFDKVANELVLSV